MACSKGPAKPAATPTPAPDAAAAATPAPPSGAVARAKARDIFKSRCATCHGPEGRGDGPGSQNLSPKPRDYNDAAWQATVTDDYLKKVIEYGGAAVGKSPTMPGNPDLVGKDDVLEALKDIVRGFAAK